MRAGPNSTIERRVQLLEENYGSLRERLEKLEKINYKQHKALTAEIAQAHYSLLALKERLKHVSVSGFKGEFIGIIFFVIGLLLAGFSAELGT